MTASNILEYSASTNDAAPDAAGVGGLKAAALCKLVANISSMQRHAQECAFGPVNFRACFCSDRVLGSCAASRRGGFDGVKSAFVPGKLWFAAASTVSQARLHAPTLAPLLTMLMTMVIRLPSAMQRDQADNGELQE